MRLMQGGGVLLMLVGLLWILQGLDVIRGSGMSGHGQYAVLGVIVGLIGVGLLVFAQRTRRGSRAV